MKKLIAIVLILLFTCSFAYGFDFGGGGNKVKVFESINDTGTQIIRDVPTTLIKPGTKIVGIVVTAAAAGGTGNTGFWDSVGQGTVVAECVAEAEMVDGHNGVQWFSFVLTVVTAIQIRQGENTVVFIYYE